ncbi:putative sterigmatocystin biosynthesis monooxygenase stcL [Glarea lozoyensis 74030]|uniref:Putative sterigmatocystin biosynthesis monooxygenase stcL n=1 Tax=Glarea lozoyensis (strain ATCC 74030 / MF5533) TaxID=1104152 RepID=H0EVX8_GLAL7|nr:putative sterigmatocystin biosynthesis monooxygenase stcL [Glarea lozoyensis 74030]
MHVVLMLFIRAIPNFALLYGSVVRITPRDLSFSSAQAWRDIYGHRKGHKDLERDPRFFFVDPAKASDIIASNEVNHARMKKLIIHAFSDSALRDQEPIILSYCDLLISRLQQELETKDTLDMAAWLNFASFDIIGDLVFGEPFYAMENGEYHWWMSTIFRSFKLGVIIRTAKAYLPGPIGDLLYEILQRIPAIVRIRAKHRGFIRDKTIARLALETDRRDFTA